MRLPRAIFGPPDFDEVDVAHELLAHQRGVMVDVGAHHGGSLQRFADDEWQVFAFEPDPKNRAALVANVGDATNVSIDDRAISAVDGDEVSFFTSDVSSGISSMASFHPSHQATATVKTVRLSTFLEAAGTPQVTFLKTDTEGFDLPVLQTFPWGRQRPRAVVCEFEDRKTEPLGYTFDDLGEFLSSQGYAVFMSEWAPIVEYGQRHTWLGVRRYPTSLSDKAGWGNFIAVEPDLAPEVERAVGRARQRLRRRRLVERVLRR
jgi:FkbM family methyltransferase